MTHEATLVGPGESTYVVRGHWPFPVDMLRRDGSRPATDADRDAIARLSTAHAEDDGAFEDVDITLVGPSRPNTARWESFRWSVPSDIEHAFVREARARAAHERTVLASALAKLDPEERELVRSLIGKNRASR